MKYLRTLLPSVLCGSISLLTSYAQGATYTWGNTTGNWGVASNWVGSQIPNATDPTTILVFGGNVGLPASPSTAYVSTNDLPTIPFQLNQLTLQGVDTDPLNSGRVNTIQGNALRFNGETARILQNGSANVAINTPISFQNVLTLAGNGDGTAAGTVTINSAVSGVGDIVKTGTSTFRFGTIQPAPGIPVSSANTWMGTLMIEDGTVRFNNNAQAASSALRANPVNFIGNGILSSNRDEDDEILGYETSLRMGTLSGPFGAVFAGLEDSDTSNYDIVITALHNGNFGGSITLPGPLFGGTGDDAGDFVVRGPGTQTLSGVLNINKDVIVGYGSTLILTDSSTLSTQLSGAITFAGGTVKLDNSFGNFASNGRLRNGNQESSTMETIGGGTFQLIGHSSGTSEITGRLQLGSFAGAANESKLRSGHLNLQVVPSGTTLTELKFGSYERDQQTILQLSTVEFAALGTDGTPIALGGPNGRIFLGHSADPLGLFTAPLVNGLLSTTRGASSVGWATVRNAQGLHFATHGATGVTAATTSAWNNTSDATVNTRVTGAVTTQSGLAVHAVNSIRIAPAGAGAALDILGSTTLSTTAIMLAGALDYAITASGSGSIGGDGSRFFHVQSANLTVDARVTGSNFPIVKAGDGTLTLTNPNNVALNQVVAINQGALRATPGSSLPQGEIRLRGGQLEIQGGGTFSRPIGFNNGGVINTINWSGIGPSLQGNVPVDEDRGSGGFAAIGADVNIDLNSAGPTLISWEDPGFVRSGYALVFGSRSGTHRVNWTDNLSLSVSAPNVFNYNAREIRVLNNPASTSDWAQISGTISGQRTNDLLKTGPGDLELTGTNTYQGATIVYGGRLLVNGNNQTSFLHKVMDGGTLGGNGLVGDVLVEANAGLAPGRYSNLASILQTKNVEFQDSAAKFLVEIGGTSPGGDVVSAYDQLSVTGTVTLQDANLEGTFLNGFLAGPTDLFFIILNDGVDPIQGQFADGNSITIGSQTFNISYAADSVSNQFSGGNDVALQLVPEPSSALLLGLGALAAARRRRAAR